MLALKPTESLIDLPNTKSIPNTSSSRVTIERTADVFALKVLGPFAYVSHIEGWRDDPFDIKQIYFLQLFVCDRRLQWVQKLLFTHFGSEWGRVIEVIVASVMMKSEMRRSKLMMHLCIFL